jgi:adenylylsulfate kinase
MRRGRARRVTTNRPGRSKDRPGRSLVANAGTFRAGRMIPVCPRCTFRSETKPSEASPEAEPWRAEYWTSGGRNGHKLDRLLRDPQALEMNKRPPGFCIWLTGLPSAGKTTIARELVPELQARGWFAELLDGDEIRKGLSADLGFDRLSRETHAGRVAFVAKLLARNGAVPIVALISPYRASRARARAEIGRFVEVYVSTPLEVCEERDVKGLYKRARAGQIKEMTGVDDPYEPPESAEVVVDTVKLTPPESARFILDELEARGWLSGVSERTRAPSEAPPSSASAVKAD